MSSIKVLWTHPERQVAMFSIAGLAMSLALAFTYDLQIPAQWL
jgi:hypothetical protein